MVVFDFAEIWAKSSDSESDKRQFTLNSKRCVMQSLGPCSDLAENKLMSNDDSAKVLVRRPSKIKTDGHGRSVWADTVETAQLELVSTQVLKQILSSNDVENREAVKEAAKSTGEGVLARDPATGYFEIIEEDELQAILDSGQDLPKLSRPTDVTLEPLRDYADSDHLSLVSTQALRRVLVSDDEDEEADALDVDAGEYNPYDSA